MYVDEFFSRRSLIEVILFGLTIGMGMTWMSVAPLLPVITSALKITTAEAGLLTALVPLCLAIASLLSAFISDYISLKWILLIGGWMMGIFSFLSGTAQNYQILLMYRMIAAFGAGFVFPNTAPVVIQWFSPKSQTILNAINAVAPSVGISIVLFSAPTIYSIMGWREAFFIFGAIQVIFAVLWSAFGKENQASTATGKGMSLRALPKKETILLGLNMFGVNMAFSAIGTFLPSYLVNERGYMLAEAGVMTSIITLTNILSGPLGGICTARLGLRKPFLWGWGILTIVAGIGCVLLPNALLLPDFFLLGFGTAIAIGVLFTIPTELGVGEGAVRSMLSMIVFIGFLGAFISPIIVGMMQMNDPGKSFNLGFLTFSLMASLTVFTGLLIKETGSRKKSS